MSGSEMINFESDSNSIFKPSFEEQTPQPKLFNESFQMSPIKKKENSGDSEKIRKYFD